jgi:hypothetical protein
METRHYTATYHIKHGVASMGLKRPDKSNVTRTFGASGSLGAILQAERIAYELADDYLSDPLTGKTTVCMTELREKDGSIVDVVEEVLKCIPAQHKDAVRKRFFPDGAHYQIERNWLDHVLKLRSIMDEPTGQPV